MTTNTTAKALKSGYLPSASEVECYTDEQMELLAIHFSCKLLHGSSVEFQEFLDWYTSIPKHKANQFTHWLTKVPANVADDAPWRVKRNFILKETTK